MAAQIIVDQGVKPPGVAGTAREDLDVGVDVVLTAAGGPFLQHLWRLIDRPVDMATSTQASSVLATPTAASTLVSPIDVAGTYLAELLVDSGNGLGATADDIARLTFYCGPALSATASQLPRRRPAFRETLEHNVADAIFASGNERGWAQEMDRWFAYLESGAEFAVGRVSLPGGGPAALVGSAINVLGVNRTGVGVVDVSFTVNAPHTNYIVQACARGLTGGSCTVAAEAVGQFTVYRANGAGALTDADFSFVVKVI